MQTLTSVSPDEKAGIHITESIEKTHGNVLCLLAGGSALSVVEFIQLSSNTKGRTIFMMGDERVSGEGEYNNYLQLQSRYPQFVREHTVVDTSAQARESATEFATRIEKNIFEIISNYKPMRTISLQGIGRDGHTAGIFPLPHVLFTETYPDDLTYVPVSLEDLTIDSRASFTPQWLIHHVDELVGFVIGETKRKILESLVSETKPIHEMPAQIFKLHNQATIFTDITLPTT